MTPPKPKTVWIIWAAVMAIYAVMNYLGVTRANSPNALIGWGIAMPILTNLVWWVIAFRLRFYFPKNWWAFGIATAIFVGLTGFLSMLKISQAMGAVA